jgi:hypothetical protein
MRREVVCCLWAGHDLPGYSANRYGAADVANLLRGVRRFVPDGRLTVLADIEHMAKLAGLAPDAALNVLPLFGFGLRHGGWSHVFEAFTPALRRLLNMAPEQRMLVVGLDTVFVRDSSWLFDWDAAPIGLPADPYNLTGPPCDAVIIADAKGASIVWEEFERAYALPVFPHRYAGHASEMTALQHLSAQHRWPKIEGDNMHRLVSYKGARVADFGIPQSATVVYFHGHPKPRDLAASDPVAAFLA